MINEGKAVCVCVKPTQDLFDGCCICVLANPHRVTHTPGITAGVCVCLFTVGLAHSIPNPAAQRGRDEGREIDLCTYMWKVLIIFSLLINFKRHLFIHTAKRRKQIPPVALTTDATDYSRPRTSPVKRVKGENHHSALIQQHSPLPFSSLSLSMAKQWPGLSTDHHCDLWC